MMPSHFIVSIITVLWIKGVYLSKENQVFQTPTQLFWKPNDQVILNLTHKISTYDTILWYQRSAGDTSLTLIAYVSYKRPVVEKPFQSRFNVSGNGEETAYLHVLTLKYPEDSGEYFGAASMTGNTDPAYFGQGTKLTVLEAGVTITPPTVTVLPPSPKECQEDNARKKTMVCVASGFYPDHVHVFWDINGKNVTDGVATDNAALRKNNTKYYKITSRLRVDAKDWSTPDNKFTCTVSFYDGEKTTLYTEYILGVKAEGKTMTRDKYLRTIQGAKLTYGIFIAKSSVYGAFVAFLVWKLQSSTGKQNN